jgi:hypothetical protein
MSYDDSIKTIESLNAIIKATGINTNLISDGYHNFGELYEHRIVLWIALCKVFTETQSADVWRSIKHSDGSSWDGWFILGVGKEHGMQATYHLPNAKWIDCEFAETLDKSPEWDGHTSDDVLYRLKNL